MHYGYWEHNTKNLKTALINVDKFILKQLKATAKDKILDAGCGAGASAIFMAQQTGARVTGITISDVQVKQAREKAARTAVKDLVTFDNQDYQQTNFKDQSFTKIYAIESVCHTPKKIDFLKEAYRLLKPGGTLVVVDAFQIDKKFSKKDQLAYLRFMQGWEVPNLATTKLFQDSLKKVGFKKIKYYDKFKQIIKNSIILRRLAVIAYPITFILDKLKLAPPSIHNNTLACYYQRDVVKQELATHGVFVAQK